MCLGATARDAFLNRANANRGRLPRPGHGTWATPRRTLPASHEPRLLETPRHGEFMSFLRRRRRTVIVALLAVVIGTGAFAYAATNTVPGSTAGSGSGTISGYTVSNVAYTLNSTTPTNLDQVAFSISPTT